MKKSEPKITWAKVSKGLEPKVKAHSRQQTLKLKVLNNPKPYHMKSNVQDKKKPAWTNYKWPIRLWVPKSQNAFAANMLQGRSKATIMVPGQWLRTTYDRRKAYVINPNSERDRNYRVWRKPERKDLWYEYCW